MRLPIEDGIGPFSPQPYITKLCKSMRLPTADSIGIVRLQVKILNLLKLLKLLMEDDFVLERSHSKSTKPAKFFRSPIHENVDSNSPEKPNPLSNNTLKEGSILSEERNSAEIYFASRANSCNDKKLLKELGLENEKLVSYSIKECKDLASEKFGKLPERAVLPDKSRNLSLFDWKLLGGNHPSSLLS